jgi:hypothetical protein
MIILDADPEVVVYDVEKMLQDSSGYFLPDLIVTYSSGRVCLIEVKAAWALRLPAEHKVSIRLERSRHAAAVQGWDFEVWTEKDRLANAVR